MKIKLKHILSAVALIAASYAGGYGVGILTANSYNKGLNEGSRIERERMVSVIVDEKKNIIDKLGEDTTPSVEEVLQSLDHAAYLENLLYGLKNRGYFDEVSDSFYHEAFDRNRDIE